MTILDPGWIVTADSEFPVWAAHSPIVQNKAHLLVSESNAICGYEDQRNQWIIAYPSWPQCGRCKQMEQDQVN